MDEGAATVADIGVSAIEVKEGRTTSIGTLGIVRVLPTKGRRTIGPWCFVDLMSPGDVERPPPIEIGPHPHIGLATVTWLFDGRVLHGDSLGTEQLIRPGQLNLMTAGAGIAHAELGVETAPAHATSGVVGVQMWIAQTEEARHGEPRFQHLPELPQVELEGAVGRLLVGAAGGEASPAVVDHPTIGLDLTVDGVALLPTDPRFEHGVVPIDRAVKVEDAIADPGTVAVVPSGYEELRLETRGAGRVMILGGLPLGETITMWWNFVARSREEITQAWRDWRDRNEARFGPVPSQLPRIEAPAPPWI